MLQSLIISKDIFYFSYNSPNFLIAFLRFEGCFKRLHKKRVRFDLRFTFTYFNYYALCAFIIISIQSTIKISN